MGIRGCRRLDRGTTGVVTSIVVSGPSYMLNLTANSSPINACGGLVRVGRTNGLSFSGIAAVGLSRCRNLSNARSRDCHCFVGAGLLSRVGVSGTGAFIPGNGTTSLSTRYGTCSREVCGVKVSVRLLNVNISNRVNFGRPSRFFAGRARGIILSRSAVITGTHFFRDVSSIPGATIAVNVNNVVSTSGILLITGNTGGGRVLRGTFFNPVAPRIPTSVLRLRGSMAMVCDRGWCRIALGRLRIWEWEVCG